MAVLLLVVAVLGASPSVQAAPNVILWDTGVPLANGADLKDRAGWKAVPCDLLQLEADPAKSSSDPGYYGRQYSFKGDAVIENHYLTAVFWSAKGRVVFYVKPSLPSANPEPLGSDDLGKVFAELVPTQTKSQAGRLTQCSIVRHAADEAALQVSFAGMGSVDSGGVFDFDKTGVVAIRPTAGLKNLSVVSPLSYGVVPAFIGDDLVFSAAAYAGGETLNLPARNLFVGLVQGEDHELVLAWPKGNQRVQLQVADQAGGQHLIESIDFDNDGQALYLAALAAPGIWHRETLTAAYLEKDVAAQWKRPFPARWITQLSEGPVKATFAFRDGPGQVWRGVPGQYRYPVWFQGDTAYYHLGKKILPKGESIVYFLEGKETPLSVSTPVEILQDTLGRALADPILDAAGRQLRTHHRRGAIGVRRACTCGCTEAIQAVFESGEEVQQKEKIAGQVDDMIYFVQCHVARIDEYRRFVDDLLPYLHAQATVSPELKPYLDQVEQVAAQIPQECSVQKENMKSLNYAAELAQQTLGLCSKKDSNNLKAYMELLKAWRGMGGAQDYVVAQCHTITRKLYQEAGYAAVRQSQAVPVAEEIQKRCRQVLRNPDGYEIWADY